MTRTRLILLATIASLSILAGCQQEEQQQQAAPPPSGVGIITTKAEDLPIVNELPGRIAATRTAEVRPRVSGIVVERVFEQGSLVNEGDVLYRIDPAPFQVQVDSAEATLARAKAVQSQNKISSDRQERLRASNVSSQQDYDNAVALLAQADADVASAQANLADARLNLQYASVTAPISGRIGRALITEGALVSSSGTENLATIQQLDPVYADFTQSATDLIRLRNALQEGQMMNERNEAPVQLILDDGTRYAHAGKLLFSEAAVDETTGQVTLRGEFANPNNDLLPGMYVRVQIQQGLDRGTIAVPQQAIQRDTAGKAQLYVVKEDDTAELRNVTTGRTYESRTQVTQGIKVGERVIVDGFQKIRAGAKVAPTEWTPAADGEAATPPSEEGQQDAGAEQEGGEAAPAAN